MNPPASADLARASSAPRRRALSLRSQLIWGLLPIVLLPLLLVSAMGYRLTQHRSEGRLQRQLANQALLTSEGTQAVLDDLRSVPRLIARHPLVVSEALAGSATAERGGLAQLPVEVLEDRFRDRKLLRQPFRLNAHLQIMTGTAEVSKILITEKHGLTVAYSDRAVDFVQRDEQWWQRGRQDGSWISPPDFDAVARVYTVDFVQAIYNPRTQSFLGVVRATLPARKFDRLAQSVQRTGISGSQRVQLVDSLSLKVIDTFSPPGIQGELTLIGSEPLEQVIAALAKFPRPAQAGAAYASQLTETLRALPGIQQVNVLPAENGTALISFVQSQRQYKLATIPATDWLAIASMGQGEMLAVGRGTLGLFVVVTLMLGGVTTVLLVLVANKLSTPLNKLSLAAEKVAGGYPLAIPDMAIPDMTSPDLAAFNLAASDLTTPTYYANETLETRRLAGAFKQWVSVTQRLLNRQALDAKRAQAWTTLTGIAVNDLPSFKTMLDSALPNVRTLLGADRVLFAQALPDKTYAVEALTLGPDIPLQEWQPQWLLPQVTRVEEIPHTVVINQLEQSLLSADAYHYCVEKLEIHASVAVPIYGESQLFGWLIAHRCSKNRPWLPSEVTFLEQFAAQTQLVMGRLSALEQLQASRQMTAQLSDNLQEQKQALQVQITSLLDELEAKSAAMAGLLPEPRTHLAEPLKVLSDFMHLSNFYQTTFSHLQQLAHQIEQTGCQVGSTLTHGEQSAVAASDGLRQQAQPLTDALSTLQQGLKSMMRLLEMLHQSVQRQRSLAGITLNLGKATYLQSGGQSVEPTQDQQQSVESMMQSFQAETENILDALAELKAELLNSTGLLQASQGQAVTLMAGGQQLDRLAQTLAEATIEHLQASQAITTLVQVVEDATAETSSFRARVHQAEAPLLPVTAS